MKEFLKKLLNEICEEEQINHKNVCRRLCYNT